MTKQGGSGKGIDPRVLKKAVSCGLYENEEAVLRDVLPSPEEDIDDFTRIAATQNLNQQIEGLCYNQLLAKRQVILISRIGPRFKGVDVVMVVNGPKRNGALVGPKGRTAEFKIRREKKWWVHFVGHKSKAPLPASASSMAHILNIKADRMRRAIEAAARSCPSDAPWVEVALPVDINLVEDKKTARILLSSPYGFIGPDPDEAEKQE